VALVIGANDVTNRRRRQPGLADLRHAILDVENAHQVVVIKRSMNRASRDRERALLPPEHGDALRDARARQRHHGELSDI